MNLKMIAGMTGAALLAGQALAQSPLPLPAPSFETGNPFSVGAPAGFATLGAEARRVQGIARTGEWSVQIDPPGSGSFVGITTDTRNFFAPGFPFFDPIIDYNGGDIRVTAYYLIPADAPINFDRDAMGNVVAGAPAAIKLNVKGAGDPNQDNATLDPWRVEGPYVSSLITGTTNGEWRQYQVTFTQADIQNQVEVVNGFVLPPNPNRLKITIGRFNYGLPGDVGTIYFDDISIEQIQAPTCRADFNGDTFVDPDDLSDYIACYFAIPPCVRADFNGDGNADPDDLSDFIALFFGGC